MAISKEAYGPRLGRAFYLSDDVVALSQRLLGTYLLTYFDQQLTVGRIVETEAYRAPDDKACHAYGNRHTPRTATMFKEGGHAYVYLCYGIHHLFNVVTGPEGAAQAVLIRAIEPVDGIDLMLERRQFSTLKPQLSAGPGVMTKALGIHTQHTGLDLRSADSPIWLEDRERDLPEEAIMASPRVGVAYAEECALWNWRFRIKASRWTSPAK
ncbi:MAG: DNA-3-methyladenine glycosylase [Bacteroidota bacterium]